MNVPIMGGSSGALRSSKMRHIPLLRLRIPSNCGIFPAQGRSQVLRIAAGWNGFSRKDDKNAEQGAGTQKTRRRVLVVEDNLDTVHTLARLLQEMGHVVDYAINGYAGMELARRFKPDFVLIDLGLPGMDGFDLCRRLKREAGLADTRYIAITGYSQEDYRQRAKDAGFDMHFLKPLDPRVLEQLLA
jgi:CheY-like chemotaxis protein